MSRGCLAAVLIACASLALPAEAQRRADLYGRIADTSGGGIADAAITAVNEDTGFRRAVRSEPGGAYTIASLRPGIYKITVRKDGFRTAIQFGAEVAPATPTRADFTLPVGSILETITVRGAAPLLDRAYNATGIRFDREQIDRLPLNGGGLLNLTEMAPGANVTPATRGEAGQFTAAGQRPNANYFTIDGVSANTGVTAGALPAQSTGGTLPAVSAFGSFDSLISLEAVEEFRVQTSGAVAEFGRMPGANLAVQSEAGTNEFHGAFLYRIRNELFNANDWFANRAGFGIAPLRLHDVTQTFGGPLHRNHTFFFVSLQHMALVQPFVQTQSVPSLSIRQNAAVSLQPALNLFPAPNRGASEWTGATDQPASLTSASARVDQTVGPRFDLFARFSDSPSHNQFGDIEVNRLDLRARSLTLGLTARATPNLILESRANVSDSSVHSAWSADAMPCALQPLAAAYLGASANCDSLVRITIGGVGQLVSGHEGDRVQRQFQGVESGTYLHGGHTLRFGADFRRIMAVRLDGADALGLIADSAADLTDANNLWISRSDALNQSANVKELSLWAQDTWQAAARLTITAGLRWEFSPAPVPSGAVYFLDPTFMTAQKSLTPRPLWPLSVTNFAPRLGAAYRLTGDGRTVLRAGGGLYYDSSMSIAADILNGGPLSVTQFLSAKSGLFSSLLNFGFLPDLRLPEVAQWNIAVERALTANDALSLAYVGASGWKLIRREAGGEGSTITSPFALTTNRGSSNYQALQLQYRRRFVRDLEASAAYTWSHSLDNDSSDAFLLWAGPGAGAGADRGASDFDLRHSFVASLGYRFERNFLRDWQIDGIFRARSGFPITVLENEEFNGLGFINAFRPNLVSGQPVWIADPQAAGGRRLNAAAFANAGTGIQGSLGRNTIAGFGMSQLDIAAGREFRFGDRRSLGVRVEVFNALNHANFADPVKYLSSPLFGQSASLLNMMLGTGSPGSGLSPVLESGGPRMLQGSLRFHF